MHIKIIAIIISCSFTLSAMENNFHRRIITDEEIDARAKISANQLFDHVLSQFQDNTLFSEKLQNNTASCQKVTLVSKATHANERKKKCRAQRENLKFKKSVSAIEKYQNSHPQGKFTSVKAKKIAKEHHLEVPTFKTLYSALFLPEKDNPNNNCSLSKEDVEILKKEQWDHTILTTDEIDNFPPTAQKHLHSFITICQEKCQREKCDIMQGFMDDNLIFQYQSHNNELNFNDALLQITQEKRDYHFRLRHITCEACATTPCQATDEK